MTSHDETREPSHPRTAVLVLAAGHGTRLKSGYPKHLHQVAGVPIVERVIRAGMGAQPEKIITLVSPGMEDLPERLGMSGQFETLVQHPARGTGDAVRRGLEAVPNSTEWVVSLLGDSCLLRPETVAHLLDHAVTTNAKVTVLTAILPDAEAYGRIVKDGEGRFLEIREKKSDDPTLRLGRTEINSGIMVLNAAWAREAVHRIKPNPNSGEYQLTDLIEIAVSEAREGEPWPAETWVGDETVAIGVNDRVQLKQADDIVRQQVRERLLEAGVTLIGSETIFIDEDVEIGRDTVIHPFTTITGRCRIGEGCVIGPAAHLRNVTIGDRVEIVHSTVRESTIGNDSDVGPYAHLRGHCDIRERVHIGSNTELKHTVVGNDAAVGHFGYLGDAILGEGVNIGAGTVTANYDGVNKNRTIIGDHAFIGSDTVMVAPVEIGPGAKTGAGAVVNRNVAPGDLVVGVPAKPRAPRDGTTGE